MVSPPPAKSRRRNEGRDEGNARGKRRRRFLGTASIFKVARPYAGGDGEEPRVRGREGGRGTVATLSEFVRLKIYPMCTVYQAVAISIEACARLFVALFFFFSPHLCSFIFFLRAHLFFANPAGDSFFPSAGTFDPFVPAI